MTGGLLTPASILPEDDGILVGRVWMPRAHGGEPLVVSLADEHLYDVTKRFATVSELLNAAVPAASARPRRGVDTDLGPVAHFLPETPGATLPADQPYILAPCDLQPVKAAGVTFLVSLKERVIEEAARGDPVRAATLRHRINTELDSHLFRVTPGSSEATAAKSWLVANDLWSQYLEVAIGPDAEIFSKAPPLSAVGAGANVGILRHSAWNNPEPEVVLAVNRRGVVVGATLGNDVNLRDIEGRSALLLGKAKDNNGSCAVGPFIRLIDATFGMDDIRRAEVSLHIVGEDGFTLEGISRMLQISRDPEDLVRQTIGPHHQYPDGLMLFLGTMFAPTKDRGEPDCGFTHKVGDIVTIWCRQLGALINRVDYCDAIAPWAFGIHDLLNCVRRRSRAA
jgi:fumarylacetoacetate (FAA) hydrolase family protein